MLQIDYREHKVKSIFDNNKWEFKEKNLLVGDFLVNDCLVIERKTLDDLSSSIIDGRYNEQKIRLKDSGCICMYIIEGITKNTKGLPMTSLYSSILHTLMRDKFYVYRSTSVEETCYILHKLSNEFPYEDLELDPLNMVKKSARKNKDCYIEMLSCIHGISPKLAQSIKNKYPTLTDLCIMINESKSPIKELQLIDKIGKKSAQSIIDAFCC